MRKRTMIAVAAAAAMALPTAAYAAHTFADVPDGHTFHDEIDRMADVGVIDGYPDGTYRPADPITRGQAAAMFDRASDTFEGPQGEQGPQGPAGPRGATGPQGPAGQDGTDGVSGHEPLNAEVRWSPDGATETTVTCPDGKVALGGGYEIDGTANGTANGTEIVDNGPVWADGTVTGWRVAGTPDGHVNVKAWVICAAA